MSLHRVSVEVNGARYESEVSGRMSLSDFLRDKLNLTGTHLGCEHGVCGSCTVLFDGEAVRSCILLAAQADGHRITTVEGLAEGPVDDTGRMKLSALQEAFWECHAMQCGYCTPGMLMSATALLSENPSPSDDEIREALSGNICRCTGYMQIVEAVALAARTLAEEKVALEVAAGRSRS